jgi:hypothetical protein
LPVAGVVVVVIVVILPHESSTPTPIPDVQLVIALGFPLMIGWNVCVDKRNTEDPTLTTKYGDGPTWTLDGENCGFIDQRIDPIIYSNEEGSPSYSGGGPSVQAGGMNSAQGPVPDAGGNMYHPSDIEDPCRLSTSQVRVDSCTHAFMHAYTHACSSSSLSL